MNAAAAPLQIGDRVRVRSRKREANWTRKGEVEKISVISLVAFVRFHDESAEWIEFERIQVCA